MVCCRLRSRNICCRAADLFLVLLARLTPSRADNLRSHSLCDAVCAWLVVPDMCFWRFMDGRRCAFGSCREWRGGGRPLAAVEALDARMADVAEPERTAPGVGLLRVEQKDAEQGV